MRVLRHLVQQHAGLRPWLGRRRAITITKARFQDKAMPQELRQEAVVLLHALCVDCQDNMARFEAQGVIALLVEEVQALRTTDALLPNYFVIEMVSLVWTAVLASTSVTRAFLLSDGAPRLIH